MTVNPLLWPVVAVRRLVGGQRWTRWEAERTMNAKAVAGPRVRVPPPVFYLAALAIGIALEYLLWPIPIFGAPSKYVIAFILIIASVLIMPFVLMRFRRAATPFDVRKAASSLITGGPYRFSRNPTYVSLTLLYLGIGILINNSWVLILVIPVFLVMDMWVIRREERHLEAKFGEQYLLYKGIVRRWL
jgi:protein-S-isoprenylcysteine O-methyltransferase Ste14